MNDAKEGPRKAVSPIGNRAGQAGDFVPGFHPGLANPRQVRQLHSRECGGPLSEGLWKHQEGPRTKIFPVKNFLELKWPELSGLASAAPGDRPENLDPLHHEHP